MREQLILRGIAMIIRLLTRIKPDSGLDAIKLANELEKEANDLRS